MTGAIDAADDVDEDPRDRADDVPEPQLRAAGRGVASGA